MVSERDNRGSAKAGKAIAVCLVALLITALPARVAAQDAPARPKLGLALSGGGAKGLAHIGVLKVMEEAGLRPDFISGVSMGSIVGGMYAMGYSPDSLATLFRDYDWDAALSDRIDENKVIFLEKKHYFNSLISLPITRNKIFIPSGLINGQQIESGLNYYFWPVLTVTDFSQLPIPYLCVGTDIITARKVVLTGGYLPDAIRASMAIPSVFTPVKIDTALLVDGGVVRNYAVSELREMGADIIIGSYVSFRGIKEEDLKSAYGILKQIGFLTSFTDYEKQKGLTDIMIEPQLPDVSTLSFNNTDSIISKGYRDALPYFEKFKRLADSLNAIAPQPPIRPITDISSSRFDRIEVIGNSIIGDDQITGVLDIEPGQAVDRNMLAEGIELLYGKSWFEKVKYRVLPRNDSLILQIDCIERPQAMLYGSLHYDPALGSGLVFNISARDLLTPRSVINFDSFLGQYYRIRLSAMQFVDRSQKTGMEASFFADNTRLPLVRLRHQTGAMMSQNYITSLSFSRRLSLNHMMSLNGSLENQHLIPDYLTTDQIRKISYNYLKLNYTYQANTLNYKYFPDNGLVYCLSASASGLLRGAVKVGTRRYVYDKEDDSSFSFDRFYSARASFSTYASPSAKLTLNFGGEALLVTRADSVASNNNFFYLGGLDAVTDRTVTAVGFHPNQIAVKSLTGVRFGGDFEVLKDLYLQANANIFAIREPDRSTGFTLVSGYGLGISYMTIAGPITIGIMHGVYARELLYKPVKGYVSAGFSF
jgi:NTE family protein